MKKQANTSSLASQDDDDAANITSVRIVSVDHYMRYPVAALDPCYSDFRASEVKQVPVIRIFGTDQNGIKSCLHVHGVFPYLYIPYHGGSNRSDADRLAYQVAFSLDKAINISLGQANSSTQHVFKVILVKATPFYGYHRSEHQYLKIYMYNPAFIKRAANLFQNGAILGRINQPHESHVPYILQFLIDYNLYGMSFLHAPTAMVHHRQNADGDNSHLVSVPDHRILDKRVEKQTVSAQEIDIIAAFILNRLQVNSSDATQHANPGIAFIWNDERARRSRLIESPPFEVPDNSQNRPHAMPTDSEQFHQSALKTIIEQLQTNDSSATTGSDTSALLSQTLTNANASNAFEQNVKNNKKTVKKFNLNQFIQDAVYPAECPDTVVAEAAAINGSADILFDASFQVNHVSASAGSRSNAFSQRSAGLDETLIGDSHNETIVDEELIMNLSQKGVASSSALNDSLNVDDFELLEILRQLEEQEEDADAIEEDSVLAPLTQLASVQQRLSQRQSQDVVLNASIVQGIECLMNDDVDPFAANSSGQDKLNQTLVADDNQLIDSDDDLWNEFSVAFDLEEAATAVNRSVHRRSATATELCVPQMDGALDTPVKKPPVTRNSGARTPSRRESRFAPLDITIYKSPGVGPANDKENINDYNTVEAEKNKAVRTINVDDTRPLPGIQRRSTDGTSNNNHSNMNLNITQNPATCDNSIPSQSLLQHETHQPTNIECAPSTITKPSDESSHLGDLKPTPKVPPSTTRAKEALRRHLMVKLTRYNDIEKELGSGSSSPSRSTTPSPPSPIQSPPRRYPKRNRTQRNVYSHAPAAQTRSRRPAKNGDSTFDFEKYEWSTCLVAYEYDKAKNFFPMPGPSTINYYENMELPGYYEPLKSGTKPNQRKRKNSGTPGTPKETARPKRTSRRSNRKFDKADASSDEEEFPEDNDILIHSIYDSSFAFDSPSASQNRSSPWNDPPSTPQQFLSQRAVVDDDNFSSPALAKMLQPLVELTKGGHGPRPSLVVPATNLLAEPDEAPPNKSCAQAAIDNFEIAKCVNRTPFYGDPADLNGQTGKKEVGHTVLRIPGNAINDLADFQSQLGIVGLYSWRRFALSNITLMNAQSGSDNADSVSDNAMRAFWANESRLVIEPYHTPPTVRESKIWLKARHKQTKLYSTTDDTTVATIYRSDEDSPIKVRHEKPKTIVADVYDENGIIEIASSPETIPPSPSRMTPSSRRQTRSQSKRSDAKPSFLFVEAPADVTCTPIRSTNVEPLPKLRCRVSLNPVHREPARNSDRDQHLHSNASACEAVGQALLANGKHSVYHDSDSRDSDVICLGDVDDAMDISVVRKTAASATSSDDTLVKLKLERPSFVNNLNLDNTITHSDTPNQSFGITGVTLQNSFGFKMELENFQTAKANLEYNYLTILSLEIHVPTQTSLNPDPSSDAIACIFYSIQNDAPADAGFLPQTAIGVIVVNDTDSASRGPPLEKIGNDTRMTYVGSENDLLLQLVELVKRWDPDILAGYEIEMKSWGYLVQRGQAIGVNMLPLLSRVPSQRPEKVRNAEDDLQQQQDFGMDMLEYDSHIKLHGRILLDVWRLLRSEIALTSYSFENIMYHVLHRRYPLKTHQALSTIWRTPLTRWIVLQYYLDRVHGTLEIMNQLDLVGRTCELAKLFGIQFYEVLSRGSQFRVESMMLRIAKPKNIVPVTPSVQQRAHMRAPEYLPLILEPHSRMYVDPVIVLDFQSLYPSMIIAYNYCFSTCLGRVEHLGQNEPFEFGASQLRVPPKLLQALYKKDLLHISPCGAVFVKATVREGVLPRMLREILDTRLMVKQSMKLHKTDNLLQRVLHSRQLGLKLMANVTYGYTAANFSGRMPCVEVGDSVVSKGRETLERAIKMVESTTKWGCKVVYGDTDSLFVLCPGRSKEDAFKIGAEIAEAATKDNPYPVKLKLEKVYLPCILQTKKRYVGFMYESADQKEPVYEAKGIETVRRDGCPAVAKMLEKTLRILFETCDVSAIKRYVCRQFSKILAGRANIQDLIFAKEFRGINGYKPGACVPSLELTRKSLLVDRRSEPRRGQRVPYLVVNGPPGVALIRLVRSPHDYLKDESLKINALYYITKVIIPPLNRCLLLIGADVNQWFADLPRKSEYLQSFKTIGVAAIHAPGKLRAALQNEQPVADYRASKKNTISQYFSTTTCVCDCGGQTKEGICNDCLQPVKRQRSALILSDKMCQLERKLHLCEDICRSCYGRAFNIDCSSLDCPVLFMRNRRQRDFREVEHFRQLLIEHF